MVSLLESSKFWNAYVSSTAFLFPGGLGLLIHFDSPLVCGTNDKYGAESQLLDPIILPISIALLVYTVFIILTTLFLQFSYNKVAKDNENEKLLVISDCNWLNSLYGHCLHYYRGKIVWVGSEKSKGRFLAAVYEKGS